MIDAVFKDVNIALKTKWDAVFLDLQGRPLEWTRPLIKSTNSPRFKFTVEDKDGGSRKAYTGIELPDTLNVTMYETADRMVEKYLEGWMFGPDGVFDLSRGMFRVLSDIGKSMRKVKITHYRTIVNLEGSYEVAVKEIQKGVERIAVEVVTSMARFDKSIIMSEVRNAYERVIRSEEHSAAYEQLIETRQTSNSYSKTYRQEENSSTSSEALFKKQQIASLATAVASAAINRLGAVGPGLILPVANISPPVAKFPAGASMAMPKKVSIPKAVKVAGTTNSVSSRAGANKSDDSRENRISLSEEKRTQDISLAVQEISSRESLEILKAIDESVREQKLSLPKSSSKEEIASTVEYTVAIQGYDVDTLDFESGGPLTYSLSLPISDCIITHP